VSTAGIQLKALDIHIRFNTIQVDICYTRRILSFLIMATPETINTDRQSDSDVRLSDAPPSTQGEDSSDSGHEEPAAADQTAKERSSSKKKPLTAKQAAKLDPGTSTKLCEGCGKPSDVLIRCRKDETEKWFLLCPGKCWKEASGGKVDGTAETPFYRYGGVWKNKKAATSGKKPKHVPHE
jgi:hypothetical protein